MGVNVHVPAAAVAPGGTSHCRVRHKCDMCDIMKDDKQLLHSLGAYGRSAACTNHVYIYMLATKMCVHLQT